MHDIQSPSTDDSAIEAELKAKGKTAPRVTSVDVEASIAIERYFTADEAVAHTYEHPQAVPSPFRLLTFCILVLKNGFTVTGESACASLENFDPVIGRKLARAKAVDKVWALLGFRLRDRITAAERIGFDPMARPLGDPYST